MTQYEELRVWARDAIKGEAFAEQFGARFFADAEQAVRNTNIVACTTGPEGSTVIYDSVGIAIMDVAAAYDLTVTK